MCEHCNIIYLQNWDWIKVKRESIVVCNDHMVIISYDHMIWPCRYYNHKKWEENGDGIHKKIFLIFSVIIIGGGGITGVFWDCVMWGKANKKLWNILFLYFCALKNHDYYYLVYRDLLKLKVVWSSVPWASIQLPVN